VASLTYQFNRFTLKISINETIQNEKLLPFMRIRFSLQNGFEISNSLASLLPGEQIIADDPTKSYSRLSSMLNLL
jgi:hypothetical protein